MSLIIVILIALSLSMDAFSLSLAYGTLNIKEKDMRILAVIVGIFHFFMPLLGLSIGEIILNILPIKAELVVTIVLLIIGLQMIFSNEKEELLELMNLMSMIMFAFAVSIDSFSVGITLRTIYTHPIVSVTVFMIISSICTYIGLKLGKKVNQLIGSRATKLGGIMLIILAIFFYLK